MNVLKYHGAPLYLKDAAQTRPGTVDREQKLALICTELPFGPMRVGANSTVTFFYTAHPPTNPRIR